MLSGLLTQLWPEFTLRVEKRWGGWSMSVWSTKTWMRCAGMQRDSHGRLDKRECFQLMDRGGFLDGALN